MVASTCHSHTCHTFAVTVINCLSFKSSFPISFLNYVTALSHFLNVCYLIFNPFSVFDTKSLKNPQDAIPFLTHFIPKYCFNFCPLLFIWLRESTTMAATLGEELELSEQFLSTLNRWLENLYLHLVCSNVSTTENLNNQENWNSGSRYICQNRNI